MQMEKSPQPKAHEARRPPSRHPALARHSPHLTSHRNSRSTHPQAALLTSPPAQHAPRSRLPCPAQPTASSHCEHPINICPTFPPLALHDPSPAREPASRPKSPLPGPWICPAPPLRTPSPAYHIVRYLSGSQYLCSSCERDRGADTGHTCGQPCSMSRRTHPLAHCLRVPALSCRDTRADSAHSHWAGSSAQQSIADALSSGSTHALQHTCIAGTHAMQHTMGADALLLWICTHTRKSGDGMDTILK